MIGVIGIFVANKAVFLHVHKLNNGTIVEHAHPYEKSKDSNPFKSHHHSNAEYLFFQNLEILFPIVFLTLALFAFVEKRNLLIKLIKEHRSICINLYKGRAPPVS